MALSFQLSSSPEQNKMLLFKYLYPSPASPERQVAVAMASIGFDFSYTFYAVEISRKDTGYKNHIDLPVSVNQIAKGSVDSSILSICRAKLYTLLLDSLIQVLAKTSKTAPVAPTLDSLIKLLATSENAKLQPVSVVPDPLADAQATVLASVSAPSPFMPSSTTTSSVTVANTDSTKPAKPAKPKAPSMKLSDALKMKADMAAEHATMKKGLKPAESNLPPLIAASSIGEKVRGTSPGSVYYVIALDDDVKCAARVLNGQISVRIEGVVSKAAEARLAALGISKSSSGHWSSHMSIGSAPPARVIGAMLMDMGIKFKKRIESSEELKIG